MFFKLIALSAFVLTAFAQRRFPQLYQKKDMAEADYMALERLELINTFVDDFRGWQDDALNLPDERKVINVTTDIYYSQILNSEVPWIIAFVKKVKAQDHLVHSQEVFQTLQILADEYEGSVRFGIIDIQEQEYLKLSFGVFTVPQTFLIKNNVVYEMNTLAIFYDNIRSFINGNYLDKQFQYQNFTAPTIIYNKYTVYGVYAYNDGIRYYNDKQWDVINYLKDHNYTEIALVQQFVELDLKGQYHALIGMATAASVLALVVTRLLCRLFCCQRKQCEPKTKIN